MATLSQIEKAIKNTFVFGVDGPVEMYNKIKNAADHPDTHRAIWAAIPGKTEEYYNKSNWKKVYSIIKSRL